MTFKSPIDAFLHWENETPDVAFLNQPIDGTWITYTFKTAGEEIRKIAAAIQNYGFPEKSHIALLSKNCAHWIMSDLAIMMAGHVSIPIYPTLNAKSIAHILDHSDSKAIIIGKLDDYPAQKEGIPDIKKISISLYGSNDGDLWESLVKQSAPIESPYQQKPDDLVTIIYTSGTTGNPKGVMHTVQSFMNSADKLSTLVKMPEHPKLFSYLPLSHIAERAGVAMRGINMGARIYFAQSIDTFASDLEKTQPHSFGSVPRILTKFQEKVLEKLPQKKLDTYLRIPILKNLIKKKLKKKLGLSEAYFIVAGAAPVAKSLIEWYAELGIIVHQMYGMTEDCIISHSNLIETNKPGTVGKALPGVQTKFTEEGELCIKNDSLLTGYYKAPEITASVFTEDGYFKTGDKGHYDHEGYLTITGRAKDQFKTDKGKYILPAPIELELSANTDIEQVCIVGTGIPQPIVLVTTSVLGKAKSKEALAESLWNTTSTLNPSLEKHEKLAKVIVMREDWTVENGLSTPTLKVKRNSIEQLHQHYYKEWFDSKENVIFE